MFGDGGNGHVEEAGVETIEIKEKIVKCDDIIKCDFIVLFLLLF